MSDFNKFKDELPSKETLHGSLTGKNITDNEYELVLNVRDKSEMKTFKDYHDLYLK